MTPNPPPPAFDTADVIDVSRSTLEALLPRIEAGGVRLKTAANPDVRGIRPGMHLHLAPEIHLPVKGTSTMHMPGESVRFGPGDFCVMPRSMPHVEAITRPGRPVHNLVVAFHRKGVGFQVSVVGPSGQRPHGIAHAGFENSSSDRLVAFLDDAILAHQHRTPRTARRIRGALLAHVAGLLDVLAGEHRPRPEEPYKVSQCRQLVRTNLSDPDLSVRRLARWIQCAPDYLSHLFHSEAGIPLTRYISEQRVEYARDLLGSTSLNISEIAWASGFQDPGYFGRVFRKTVGVSPRAYRQRAASPS